MQVALFDVLADPLTKSPLEFDPENTRLVDPESGQQYPIIDRVPVLLPSKVRNLPEQDPLHQQSQVAFDYFDHYQKDAENFDYFKAFPSGATRHEEKRLHQTIINAVPPDARIILDVGCGKGWVGDHFCKQGREVVSMDISTVNPIRVHRRIDSDNHIGLVGDVFHLPIRAGAVDCVIASEIIEHVPDPELFIQNLMEALKPGGKLIITTPYKEDIQYYLCVHCNRPTPQHAHLHSFDEASMERFLPKRGISWKFSVFSDKYLTKARLHILLKYAPHSLWRWIDWIANKTFGRPVRFLVEVKKEMAYE